MVSGSAALMAAALSVSIAMARSQQFLCQFAVPAYNPLIYKVCSRQEQKGFRFECGSLYLWRFELEDIEGCVTKPRFSGN